MKGFSIHAQYALSPGRVYVSDWSIMSAAIADDHMHVSMMIGNVIMSCGCLFVCHVSVKVLTVCHYKTAICRHEVEGLCKFEWMALTVSLHGTQPVNAMAHEVQ